MGSGDADRDLRRVDNASENLGALENRNATPFGFGNFRILPFHSIGDDDCRDARRNVLCGVRAGENPTADALQSKFRRFRDTGIGAGNVDSPTGQDEGDGAHSSPADTDEVNGAARKRTGFRHLSRPLHA